jgi:hypothetical protein
MRESRFDRLMLVNSAVGLVTAVLSWRDVQPGVTRPVFILSMLLVATGPFLRRFVVRPRPTPTEPVEDGSDPWRPPPR